MSRQYASGLSISADIERTNVQIRGNRRSVQRKGTCQKLHAGLDPAAHEYTATHIIGKTKQIGSPCPVARCQSLRRVAFTSRLHGSSISLASAWPTSRRNSARSSTVAAVSGCRGPNTPTHRSASSVATWTNPATSRHHRSDPHAGSRHGRLAVTAHSLRPRHHRAAAYWRVLGWIALVLCLPPLAWLVWNRIDEAPNADALRWGNPPVREVPDADNAWLYLFGVGAAENDDPVAYGRRRAGRLSGSCRQSPQGQARPARRRRERSHSLCRAGREHRRHQATVQHARDRLHQLDFAAPHGAAAPGPGQPCPIAALRGVARAAAVAGSAVAVAGFPDAGH